MIEKQRKLDRLRSSLSFLQSQPIADTIELAVEDEDSEMGDYLEEDGDTTGVSESEESCPSSFEGSEVPRRKRKPGPVTKGQLKRTASLFALSESEYAAIALAPDDTH